MDVPDCDWDQVNTVSLVAEDGYANLLGRSEKAKHDSSYVTPLFVKTNCGGLS